MNEARVYAILRMPKGLKNVLNSYTKEQWLLNEEAVLQINKKLHGNKVDYVKATSEEEAIRATL